MAWLGHPAHASPWPACSDSGPGQCSGSGAIRFVGTDLSGAERRVVSGGGGVRVDGGGGGGGGGGGDMAVMFGAEVVAGECVGLLIYKCSALDVCEGAVLCAP